MIRTVVALGDSFSCGEGVGLDIRPEQTWTAQLCAALPDTTLVNLSAAGARVRDVRRRQLPPALAARPQLATIMVGLNDTIRSGLDADKLTHDMRALVGELRDSGAIVLVARWHDPGLTLGAPLGWRRAYARRLAVVNNAIDAATGSGDLAGSYPLILDLACVPELAAPGAWAVDGVHPSPAGHRAIALSARLILEGIGVPDVAVPPATRLPIPPGPSRVQRTRWILSRGLPWLLQHSGRVLPAVTSMAVDALWDRPDVERVPFLAVEPR